MKYTKILTLTLAALLVISMLCGCGASTADSKESSYEPSYDEGYYDSEASYELSEDYGTGDSAPAKATAPSSEDSEIERKIVRNADLRLEADDAKGCYASLLEYASSLGGYESYCRIDSDETSSYYRYVRITATVKLPPDKLDDFLSKAGELAKVTYNEVTSKEITAQYYDAQLRLKTLRRQLDSYTALLEKAETMEDIITVQTRIDELVSQIESLEGTLRYYDSMVDESTVELTVTQELDIPVAEKEFEWDSLGAGDFFKLIKNGFLGVLNFVWSALLWIIIILISASPLILIGVGIYFAYRAWRKKHPKKEKTKRSASVVNYYQQPVILPTPAAAPESSEAKKE